MSASEAAIWHDLECGAYAADLPLWMQLAERHGDPILELGCGTGRVALHLARRGHRVLAVDHDHELILELAERARDLPVEPLCVDALDLAITEPVALALAPMQFIQLLRSSESRVRCLRRVAAALHPGGLLAVALLGQHPPLPAAGAPPPLPDVREVDGWIYSSQPTVLVGMMAGQIILRRQRQVVSPAGELREETNMIQLVWVDAGELYEEGEAAGLSPVGGYRVDATADHVGSIVILLRREA